MIEQKGGDLMASLIDPERIKHFEQLQLKKRRTDKINQWCFLFICAIALEAVIALIVGIGSDQSRDLIHAVFLCLSVTAAFIGCLRRNLIMNIIAVILYLAGFFISKEYQQAFLLTGLSLHLLPYCCAVYANFIEQQLRQEEGYPQFDLISEEQALQTQFAQQTSYAALNKQKNEDPAPDPLQSPAPAQQAEQPAAPPPDMDYI